MKTAKTVNEVTYYSAGTKTHTWTERSGDELVEASSSFEVYYGIKSNSAGAHITRVLVDSDHSETLEGQIRLGYEHAICGDRRRSSLEGYGARARGYVTCDRCKMHSDAMSALPESHAELAELLSEEKLEAAEAAAIAAAE